MSKVPAPIAQFSRLINLVPYLISHQGISLKKLASDFGVSEKEMISDLNTLWMCGLPGYTPLELIDLEFESGYVSIRNADVLNRVRALNQTEIISLQLGLSLIQDSLLNDDQRKALLSLRDKLTKLSGNIASLIPSPEFEIGNLIAKAITSRRDIAFKYYSLDRDEVTERVVTPHKLYNEGSKIYLQGFCKGKRSIRTFALERMSEIVLGDESAHVLGELSMQSEVLGIDAQLKTHGRGREVMEAFRAIPMGNHLYRTVIFNGSWLVRNVSRYGGEVELVEPRQLRAEIVEAAKRALDNYS